MSLEVSINGQGQAPYCPGLLRSCAATCSWSFSINRDSSLKRAWASCPKPSWWSAKPCDYPWLLPNKKGEDIMKVQVLSSILSEIHKCIRCETVKPENFWKLTYKIDQIWFHLGGHALNLRLSGERNRFRSVLLTEVQQTRFDDGRIPGPTNCSV